MKKMMVEGYSLSIILIIVKPIEKKAETRRFRNIQLKLFHSCSLTVEKGGTNLRYGPWDFWQTSFQNDLWWFCGGGLGGFNPQPTIPTKISPYLGNFRGLKLPNSTVYSLQFVLIGIEYSN